MSRLGAGCPWLDAAALPREAAWTRALPTSIEPTELVVRTGLPLGVNAITARMIGHCAMALHVMCQRAGVLHEAPEAHVFMGLADDRPCARVPGPSDSADVNTEVVAVQLGASGGGRIGLRYSIQPGEVVPFVANLVCAQRCYPPGSRKVRVYHSGAYIECADTRAWRTRTLLVGLSRFLLSLLEGRPPRADCDALTTRASILCTAWAAVIDEIVRPALEAKSDDSLDRLRQLAAPVDPLTPTQWQALARAVYEATTAEHSRPPPKTRSAKATAAAPAAAAASVHPFHGAAHEYCAAPKAPSAQALLRLGWGAVALSTGVFAVDLATPPDGVMCIPG